MVAQLTFQKNKSNQDQKQQGRTLYFLYCWSTGVNERESKNDHQQHDAIRYEASFDFV